MWSVGCIFAELLKSRPLFPAGGEVEALAMMCKLLGSPNENNWPGIRYGAGTAAGAPNRG